MRSMARLYHYGQQTLEWSCWQFGYMDYVAVPASMMTRELLRNGPVGVWRFLRLATPDGRLFDPMNPAGDDFLGRWRLPETAAQQRLRQLVVRLLCGVPEVTEVSHGAIQPVVVTASASKISSTMFSRFLAHPMFSLPFWQIEAW